MLREILVALVLVSASEPGALEDARRLRQTGRYAEAEEAYESFLKSTKDPSPAARATAVLGRAECLASQGEYATAIEALETLARDQPDNADLAARAAELKFLRGDWDGATALVEKARKVKPDHLLARWVEARLFEARGQLDPAVIAWKWFIDHYNDHMPELSKDAENLILVGQAAERYYRATQRGSDLKESLDDVLTELYEGALRIDPFCWQAALLQGRLFLSGYDESNAMKELSRAQQINPEAPEILVTIGQADLQGYKLASGRAKAERALQVNPHFAPAYILLADLNISDERFTDAKAAAQKAVTENPRDEDGLARLAASCRLLVDPMGAAAVEAAVLARNVRPATFYAALGERLADRRKYESAERAFLLAIAADSHRADAPIGLGMLYMQIGREDEAFDLFKSAFDADPFNVRANNQMEVLKHMAAYKTVATDHYQVMVDPEQDDLLGRYMARYLESIHGELTTRFGFNPPEPTKVEILKTHRWFGARTVGLTFIPTVGACTGKVIALASPRPLKKAFNWSRVLKHELVHVITLQQTNFNIPHWYTEALAVESEGLPRPQEWNKMLLERVPTRSKLLNLDTINLGFIRPKEAEDRQMAYCQAQLYAQYMLKRFGKDALIKMLDAYRRGLTTDRAIRECFHVEKDEFESAYLTFLDGVIKTIRTRVNEEKPIRFSQLERLVKEKPDDAELNAKMAYEHFARRDYKEARPFADKALKLEPHQPLASYVKARLLTTIGDDDAALSLLEPALDPAKPNERVIDLLAELQMKAGNLDEAERLYELARKDDPAHSKWIAGLARVHLRQKNQDKFLADLAMLADNDGDDLEVRTALAARHLAAGHAQQAEQWATECIYIDTYNPASHVLLGDAFALGKKYANAIDEYKTALDLKVKRPNDVRVKLARAEFDLGQRKAAMATLDAVLNEDPDHPEAKELRKKIGD